jgi:hypothetical protein
MNVALNFPTAQRITRLDIVSVVNIDDDFVIFDIFTDLHIG